MGTFSPPHPSLWSWFITTLEQTDSESFGFVNTLTHMASRWFTGRVLWPERVWKFSTLSWHLAYAALPFGCSWIVNFIINYWMLSIFLVLHVILTNYQTWWWRAMGTPDLLSARRKCGSLGTCHAQLVSGLGAVLGDWALSLWGLG